MKFFYKFFFKFFLALPEIINISISKVEMEIRNTLYKNIFISGGNSLIKGFPERMTNEIKKLSPKNMKIKVNAPMNRKHSCWSGASLISTLASFKGMWVKRNVIIFYFLFNIYFFFIINLGIY
jgi:centractin